MSFKSFGCYGVVKKRIDVSENTTSLTTSIERGGRRAYQEYNAIGVGT